MSSCIQVLEFQLRALNFQAVRPCLIAYKEQSKTGIFSYLNMMHSENGPITILFNSSREVKYHFLMITQAIMTIVTFSILGSLQNFF